MKYLTCLMLCALSAMPLTAQQPAVTLPHGDSVIIRAANAPLPQPPETVTVPGPTRTDSLYCSGAACPPGTWSTTKPVPPPPPPDTTTPPPAARVGKYVAPNGSGTACTFAAPCNLDLLATNAIIADTIWARGGTYILGENATSTVTGTPAKPRIVRAYPGERVTWDLVGNGQGLTIRGADAWYWGIEFVCKAWTSRRSALSGSWPDDIPCTTTSVNVFAPRVKFINNNLHDLGEGFDFWKEAVDAELYGNLIYYVGWLGADRGHGHVIYTQNSTGTKQIRENLTWDAYGSGVILYGSGAAEIRGYNMVGNAAWNHGAPAGGGYGQYLLGGAGGGADITFRENFCYRTGTEGAECIRAGYTQTGANTNFDLINNYVIGGDPAWRLWNLSAGSSFTGNTTYAPKPGPAVHIAVFGAKPSTWTGNTHVGSQTTQSWGWANAGHTWASFKTATGLGASDTYAGTAPSGVRVFVRPNQYEPGRAHVIVYSHSGATTASVDLSGIGLTAGRKYDVKNAQNFYGPTVATGTGPGIITLPLSGLSKAAILGTAPHPITNTGPAFNAFVVLPK